MSEQTKLCAECGEPIEGNSMIDSHYVMPTCLKNLKARVAALEAENERVKKASRTRADYDLRCGECGAAHNLDTSIPSDLWNQIAAPADILCVLCIDEKLTKKGLQCDVAEFYYVGTSLSSRKYAETSGEIQRLNRDIATLTSDNSRLTLELEAARAKATELPKICPACAHTLTECPTCKGGGKGIVRMNTKFFGDDAKEIPCIQCGGDGKSRYGRSIQTALPLPTADEKQPRVEEEADE